MGSDQNSEQESAQKITRVLRDFLAPDALDSVRQNAGGLPHFKRAKLTVGDYLARPDQSRRKDGARMQMVGSFPVTFVAILRTQKASLFRAEQKSVELASAVQLGDCCGGKADETII